MTDVFTETPAEPTNDRLQIIAAVILGVAATLTAVAVFNAALKDGEALEGYTTSTRELNDANYFFGRGDSVLNADQALFIEWVNADKSGDTELATYFQELMRPELQAAIDWFLVTDEALTPFDDLEGNPYVISEYDEASALEDDSKASYAEAKDADDQGDVFELSVVFFALTLFFGGVATLFHRRGVSIALLAMSTVTLLAGAGVLFTALTA